MWENSNNERAACRLMQLVKAGKEDTTWGKTIGTTERKKLALLKKKKSMVLYEIRYPQVQDRPIDFSGCRNTLL